MTADVASTRDAERSHLEMSRRTRFRDRWTWHRGVDRGVSTAVSYVLILGIIALLGSSLFLAIGPFVAGQSDQTTRSSMGVVGNQLATDLQAADRLADAAGTSGTVELRAELPERIGGSQYRISVTEIAGEHRYEITLRSIDSDTVATVTIQTDRPVEETGAIAGGPLTIEYDTDGEMLVIHEA